MPHDQTAKQVSSIGDCPAKEMATKFVWFFWGHFYHYVFTKQSINSGDESFLNSLFAYVVTRQEI